MADNNFNFGYNPETGNYEPITDRNAVGMMKTVNNWSLDDPFDPVAGTHQEFAPSKYDFTGATYDPKLGAFKMPDGKVVAYSAGQDMVTNYIPVAPTFFWTNKAGQYVGNYTGDLRFQGQPFGDEQYGLQGGYLVDPNTKQYLKDSSGNYILPYDPGSGGGGFADWMTENGWVLPLAMAAGAAGGAALGAGAAGEAGAGGAALAGEAGAGGLDAYMASAGLNPGTYAAADFAPGYASMGDYMSQAGLDTGNFSGSAFTSPDANPLTDYMNQAGLDTGKFEGSAFEMPSSTSASDAYKTLSRANNLAKLLSGVAGMGSSKSVTSGTSGTSGINPQQLASLLGGGQQTNSFIGQIKGNQNPFLFTPPNQTQATEGTYDVSGSNLANALRKA
jgi:hypothetical protein